MKNLFPTFTGSVKEDSLIGPAEQDLIEQLNHTHKRKISCSQSYLEPYILSKQLFSAIFTNITFVLVGPILYRIYWCTGVSQL